LQFDTKEYRKADFYLPRFGVYVEFLGMYQPDRNPYAEKIHVYRRNNIPCVYLYPENLGIIHYIFDRRIQSVLIRLNMERELRAYRWYKLKKSATFNNAIMWSGGIMFIILFELISHKQQIGGYVLTVLLMIIPIYQSFVILHLYRDIFKKDKFYLNDLRD
jgi:hypothetical protein